MIYRELGKTGIDVSALGFGSMYLPLVNIGREKYVDTDRAVDTIRWRRSGNNVCMIPISPLANTSLPEQVLVMRGYLQYAAASCVEILIEMKNALPCLQPVSPGRGVKAQHLLPASVILMTVGFQ